VTCTFPVGGA